MAKRVLIVDDAAFMRIKLKDILEKNEPDLVTMDITMPEKDGVEALKEIKAMDPKAVVLMCSAMGQQSMVMDAIRAGAIDVIVKPFDTERVIKALDKASQ